MSTTLEQATARLSNDFVSFLERVFAELLGPPATGSVAFCRCLSPQMVEDLAANTAFAPQRWEIRAVVGNSDPASRQITSDQAVEIREDKGNAILLLVNGERAGAGMDGIYSASRELTEEMLFNGARDLVRAEIGRELFEKAEFAIKQVHYIGERRSLSKWQQIEFLASLYGCADEFGRAITLLGLWPIQGEVQAIGERDLRLSARIVDRLLFGSGTARTPAERVASLLLEGATEDQKVQLQQLVREAAKRPVLAVVQQVVREPIIWLNEIRPKFLDQEIQHVKIRSWRDGKGKTTKWSGLTDGNPPQFLLSRQGKSKLEVRFDTAPERLPRGSVEYRVSVVSGDDELAYRHVSHTERKGSTHQAVKLTTDDFEGIEEDSQFEARVVVLVVGLDAEIADESEEFLVRFGEGPGDSQSSSSNFVRGMIEGAINISDVEQFDKDVADSECFAMSAGKNHHVAFRPPTSKKSYKVKRPTLIEVLERMQLDETAVGRWSVRVREDGQRVADPEFHPLDRGEASEVDWDRAIKAMARLREDLAKRGGFWGSVYSGSVKRIEELINAWLPVLEGAPPLIALAETVEIQSLAGATIGLIVLPSHPLRIAWHVAYDQLLRYMRYDLGLSASRVKDAVANLQPAHFPSILPGPTAGQHFVYADTLSFFATAMVSDQDPEPKSAVALLMRSLGLEEHDPTVSSMGFQVSSSLAREVSRYIKFHNLAESCSGAVLLHALRPGDGGTVARALGKTLRDIAGANGESSSVRFHLEMYPASPESDITGSFLVDLVERHRTGAAGIADDDRWMLESQAVAGGVTLPRLRWARKDQSVPNTPAHVAVAFDSFDTRVEFVPLGQLPSSAPLHVYGLVANSQRSFQFQPTAQWMSWLPPESDGEKHPAARVISDRLLKLSTAMMRCVCRHGDQAESSWPVLRTRLSAEHREALEHIHELSDWVITIDRNAGIEFFDAPRDEPSIYKDHVIDCVPERDDLGALQMITSTTRTDEIRELLDEMLETMSLSASRRNCEFLVRHLKALSGRLALRLTCLGSACNELIALALVHSQCEQAGDESEFWMSLRRGFFIPVDDIPDLAPKEKSLDSNDAGAPAPRVRSDLVYVTMPGRGGLSFTFVEVKYRRNLRAARAPELGQQIGEQTNLHREAWMNWYFDATASEPVLAIRRSQLVRAMRFYLNKARRHYLDQDRYDKLRAQLDRLMAEGANYRLSDPPLPTRGFIFCPEYVTSDPSVVSDSGSPTRIVLFGATTMPDLAVGVERTANHSEISSETTFDNSVGSDAASAASTKHKSEEPGDARQTVSLGSSDPVPQPSIEVADGGKPGVALVRFGVDAATDDEVQWSVSKSANPHLMIVGFPGMGKTEAVMNICRQLHAQAITPIVFSYHPDIDERLSSGLSNVRLLDHHQLGFNPMHLDAVTPTSHVDSAGMLRDVFAAMFPELGDIQLERLRAAIRESYRRHGWGGDSDGPTIPEFREFYTILKHDQKPERNLIARLDELDDYQIFSNSGDVRSLLDCEIPSVLRIHATQNEFVQRAVAMLALYNIYKEMFRRGVQPRITHAVVFDEAHRASKMKLLPKLAAECRKFGISLILASQAAKDFDTGLYSNIASYLLLRMTDQDANVLAKNITTSDQARRTADRLKQLERYHALFFREGHRNPTHLRLDPPA